MIQALLARVASTYGDELREDGKPYNALDYAVAWVENGRTLAHLCYDLTNDICGKTGNVKPQPIGRSMLTRYLATLGDASALLGAARTEGAHALVEDGLVTLDEGSDERDVVNANDRRLIARERLAAVWNTEYRNKNNGITLNFGAQFLEALKNVNANRPAIEATATLALPEGENDVE